MKRIALIHTVPTVYMTFAEQLRIELGDVLISNTLDDFLASDAEIRGEFSINNMDRLYKLLKAAEETGPDLIAVTCSTLSPAVISLRQFFKIPIVTIDELMIREAVRLGEKIMILSTAESTVKPTREKLKAEGIRIGKEVLLDNIVCHEAYKAIKNQDKSLHDVLILAVAREIRDYDVIVLAQASMAHLEQPIHDATGITVVSSPRYCVQEIKEILSR
ncbi:aspartate/glutamate racemase family protein [uncultured Sphaerochaeta sp.]|uniref:aspartate/glutamate racemase family protein n=1 Tax=uncultured Sphaerochaeta sp. TaxID=886478 RepID=UPI002A0A2DAF|nr:aspartate/glutamate racemase family protein [uncultured Sphaerochaeta sp.]